jgi:hypothetical protein
MDKDLEKILNNLWKKNPYPDKEYCKVEAILKLVQELRNIQKYLKKK